MCECGGLSGDVALFIQDFNISEEQTRDLGGGGMGMGLEEGGGDGGMEEWEDDGWGTFEEQEENKNAIPSSGADFFDTLDIQKKKSDESEDLFARLGVGGGGGGKGEKRPNPPPVSANLFGSSSGGGERGGGGGGGGGKVDEEAGDWGDWGTEFSSTQVQPHIHTLSCNHVYI